MATLAREQRQEVDFRDVRDPAAFVWATIERWARPTGKRGPIVLSDDEREELFAEGMAIMVRLARQYVPRMDGYDKDGRFSGYAAMFLPRKLGDAWHKLHPEHQMVEDPETGRRTWAYEHRAVSLNALAEEDADRMTLLADTRAPETDLKGRLHATLLRHWKPWLEIVAEVGQLLSEGASKADCAHMLGLSNAQVDDAIKAIAPVISRLQSEET